MKHIGTYFWGLGILIALSVACTRPDQILDEEPLYPEGQLILFRPRVDIQSEYATADKILDGKWVAVGLGKRDYTPCVDTKRLYHGEHSYRFELRGAEDNKLPGYSGGSKGRTELSWCYATDKDFDWRYPGPYERAQLAKTVYFHGKGHCPQGASMQYRFAIFVPDDLSPEASGIFAQWHGMPSRTLARKPDGEIIEMTEEEFVKLSETMVIDQDKGYEKKADGRKGKENGWMFEQGGYPPMAFAFGKGFFYIQANSDRSWMTDKSIRCNINPETAEIGDFREAGWAEDGGGLKRSTLAYKLPIGEFPKNCWVTFDIRVDWTKYGQKAETVVEPGLLDVGMSWVTPGTTDGPVIRKKLVDRMEVLIGRNDRMGYYFKFGIYRSDGSEVPVSWSLAGYEEKEIV